MEDDSIGVEAITVFFMALAVAIRHVDRTIPDHDIQDRITRTLNTVRLNAETDYLATFGATVPPEVRFLQSFLESTLDRPQIEGPPLEVN